MMTVTLTLEDNCPESTKKALVDMINLIAETKNLQEEYEWLYDIHKGRVLKDIGGSLVNQEDYWSEYCKVNNINK